MSFSDAVRTCFSKYVTFSGRATRPEYWWFFLFLLLASFALGFVDGALFGGDVAPLGRATPRVQPAHVRRCRASTRCQPAVARIMTLHASTPTLAGWRWSAE